MNQLFIMLKMIFVIGNPKSRKGIFGRGIKTGFSIGSCSWPGDKLAFDIEYKFKAQGCFFQFF